MKSDPELEAKVLAYLKHYAEAARHREFVELQSAHSPELFGFGTGPHERWVGREEYEVGEVEDQQEVDWVEREYKWVHAVQRDELVMFATEYDLHWAVRGSRCQALARLTGVLERHEGRWRLLQSHMSFPAINQDVGQAWPTPIEAVATAVASQRPDLRAQVAPDGTVTRLFTDVGIGFRPTSRQRQPSARPARF